MLLFVLAKRRIRVLRPRPTTHAFTGKPFWWYISVSDKHKEWSNGLQSR